MSPTTIDPDIIKQAIGRRIARDRTRAGLTQKQLAEKVHLSRGTICAIECGHRSVRGEEVKAFLNALGGLSWLLD